MNDSNVIRPRVSKVEVQVRSAVHDPLSWRTTIQVSSSIALDNGNFNYYPILNFDSSDPYDMQGMTLTHEDGKAVYRRTDALGMDDPQTNIVDVDVERDGNLDNATFVYNREPQ
jgi:hypothetical protein